PRQERPRRKGQQVILWWSVDLGTTRSCSERKGECMSEQKIGALWKRLSKRDGSTYLTGIIDNNRKVVVLRVKEKRSDKSPDFQIFLSESAPIASKEQAKQKSEPAPAAKPAPAPVISDDDIPF